MEMTLWQIGKVAEQYEKIEEINNTRLASILCMMVNTTPRKKGSRPAKVSDFLPKKQKSEAEMEANLASFLSANATLKK